MKRFICVTVCVMCAAIIPAGEPAAAAVENRPKRPLFSWDFLWAGSWEENKTFLGRGDFRVGAAVPGLLTRTQAVYKTPLIPRLELPFGDPAARAAGFSFGLYHPTSGSRLLYGVLDEWGLPARIRGPWLRSSPFSENHRPVITDLKTAVSDKTGEAHLYLSTPPLKLDPGGAAGAGKAAGIPVRMRGFASAGIAAGFLSTAGKTETGRPGGKPSLSFAGGLETFLGAKTELSLEGFYTGSELPPLSPDSWFPEQMPLPARNFRLGAAALLFRSPFFSVSSDWAWSQAFAAGGGFYGGGGIRLSPPPFWNGEKAWANPGPLSVSLAADGIGGRYTGRDGSFSDPGFRAAGKIEWRGTRNSLLRFDTVLRHTDTVVPGAAADTGIGRSSLGAYYRLPAAGPGGSFFPVRLNRISLNAGRNAEDPHKIRDSFSGEVGLSLILPPLPLPAAFLPVAQRPAAAKTKNAKPKMYPLGITLSAQAAARGSSNEPPPPYPFVLPERSFDSAKAGCELLWSPGIFQFRTRWAWETTAGKGSQWEAAISAAVRFKHGRFSVKAASPDFPEEWNCTLSWRLEK